MFYLNIRKKTMHPAAESTSYFASLAEELGCKVAENPRSRSSSLFPGLEHFWNSVEDYYNPSYFKARSMKIDAMLEIAAYHLGGGKSILHIAQGGPSKTLLCPMTEDELRAFDKYAADQRRVQACDIPFQPAQHLPLPKFTESWPKKPSSRLQPQDSQCNGTEAQDRSAWPDKIIFYCAFPSNYAILRKAFSCHGLDFLEVSGEASTTARDETIKSFGAKGGPRILLLSIVGAVGLNIARANILAMVVSLLSMVETNCLKWN
jgi:hypothetical protein